MEQLAPEIEQEPSRRSRLFDASNALIRNSQQVIKMSLLHSLPAPQQVLPERETDEVRAVVPVGYTEPPPYLRRTEFIPRKESDFGDGGAFPEIPVAQYPLGMGKEKEVAKTLTVTIDADGAVNYDAVVKQGQNRDKTVFSRHSDLVPRVDELNALATIAGQDEEDEEVKETARDTWDHLQRVVDKKIQAANPKTIGPRAAPSTLIKYTPSQQGHRHNSGCSQRIVKLHEMPQDPLDPPKFRHVRVPKGPGDPPVPILHSPPRKVTHQDQQDWKIPPCISNWKNQKGYTIPLDKRLAADGRGLQESTVSEKFAAFTESLYSAEHKAREALHMRNKVQRELMAREKEKKEKELRELAQRARMEHGGMPLSARVDVDAPIKRAPSNDMSPASASPDRGSRHRRNRSERSDNHRESRQSREEIAEKRRRDEIREERRRERERERRLEARDAKGTKKSKTTRDRERDISEKIALGMAKVQTNTSEALYDSRLFNQERGMATGFGAEDGYHVYDKPLFLDKGSGLYKPKQPKEDELYGEEGDGIETGKFKADTGFKGAEEPMDAVRTGPVEFDADPFELDNDDPPPRDNVLERLGQRGGMNAAAGGSMLADPAQGSSRTRIRFQGERN